MEIKWRPRRLWWHRGDSRPHMPFKNTRRGMQRATERRYVRGRKQ